MSELEFAYKYDENGKVVDISCKTVSGKKFIWYGTGGNDPEGPHIYKINGCIICLYRRAVRNFAI